MITYTSKKKSFVITALSCDLFTSTGIYTWQRRIYIRKSSVRLPLPPAAESYNCQWQL